MSSSKRQHRLEVRVEDRIGSETEITILNAFDVAVKRSSGSVRADLPRGLFTVRLEHAGNMEEHIIRHVRRASLTYETPKRHSSLPVSGTSTNHEYYRNTSSWWSTRDTREPILGTDGRIFIFVRAIRQEDTVKGPLTKGLKLLDSEGSTVVSFTSSEVETGDEGWTALSAFARPGIYYLLHKGGGEHRAMPLHVFAGWNTQAFVTHHDAAARLQSASVLTPSITRGFDPNDHIATSVDLALKSLKSGKNFIPPGPMDDLLKAKFRNPMLGILGAYLLLLGRSRLPKKNQLDLRGIRRIIRRIERLVGASADVSALKLLTEELFEKTWHGEILPLKHPPMVRAGLEAVVRASVRRPKIIPADSLTEEASVETYVDSPWTTWKSMQLGGGALIGVSSIPPWIKQYITQTIRAHSDSGRALDLVQIAGGARVPMGLVERAYRALGEPDLTGDAPRSDLTRILGIGERHESFLQALGIRDFESLASLDKGDIQMLPDLLRVSPRQVNNWVGQARRIAGGSGMLFSNINRRRK